MSPEGNYESAIKPVPATEFGGLHQYKGMTASGLPVSERYLNSGHPRNPNAIYKVPRFVFCVECFDFDFFRVAVIIKREKKRCTIDSLTGLALQTGIKNGSYRPLVQFFDPSNPKHPAIPSAAQKNSNISC